MRFLEILKQKKFTGITIFLVFYIVLNLLDGERGLISYYQKKQIRDQLINQKQNLTKELFIVENKNRLLDDPVDLDYLETLFRKNFMVGKKDEKIYIIE